MPDVVCAFVGASVWQSGPVEHVLTQAAASSVVEPEVPSGSLRVAAAEYNSIAETAIATIIYAKYDSPPFRMITLDFFKYINTLQTNNS